MFTWSAQANAAVIEQIRRARPHWLDVQPASSLISELNKGENTCFTPGRRNSLAGDDQSHEGHAWAHVCSKAGRKSGAQALAILERGK
ncbi:hypothetical protein ACLK19_03480 [Escherichia coli]